MRHPVSGRSTAIPVHARDVKRGVLLDIIKQAGLTQAEFLRLLRS
jgi:predicted RNA binding protein YcfA (HicA-like mRNA interferase family)